MSTSTNPDEMPKEALEAEPDAGEMNEAVSLTRVLSASHR
jgi:hypothetical protein